MQVMPERSVHSQLYFNLKVLMVFFVTVYSRDTFCSRDGLVLKPYSH